jgi:hypothetical protein
MKSIWAHGLSVSLGCLTSGIYAQESQPASTSQPAIVQSASSVTLGRPIGVGLGRPVPANSAPTDAIAPVSYQAITDADLDRPRRLPSATSWASHSAPANDTIAQTGFASDGGYMIGAPIVPGGSFGPESAFYGDDCCVPGPVGKCGRAFYVSADYLLWGIKDSRFPPLVTTSQPGSFGILGFPDTTVLFGGGSVDNELRSGGRFTIGIGLPRLGDTVLETSFLFLNERTVRFGADSTQFPVLARPFFNLNEGIEFSEITAFPDLATGRIDISSSSRLWGGEINLRKPLWSGPWCSVDWLCGFRYLDLNEALTITENVSVLAGDFAGSNALVLDHFGTQNRFYGGQLGLLTRCGYGPWTVDLWGKLAVGNTNQIVNVVGNQTVTSPGGAVTNFTGGLLALDSNIGRHARDQFAVVPELGLNVGYQLGNNWRLMVGYNFLYWSSVLRPGDQIDRVLDVTRIPNFATNSIPAPQVRPVVTFKDSGFWAQGANFGVEFRY